MILNIAKESKLFQKILEESKTFQNIGEHSKRIQKFQRYSKSKGLNGLEIKVLSSCPHPLNESKNEIALVPKNYLIFGANYKPSNETVYRFLTQI